MQKRLFPLVFTALFALHLDALAGPLDFTALTNIATRYKLPMPPKDARLVLAHTERWSVLGNRSTSRDPGIYSPAFLLEERTNGSIAILRGTEIKTLTTRPNEQLWRPFSTSSVKPRLGGHAVEFGRLSAFVTAVQLAQRGEESTAQEVWLCFSKAEWWSDGQPFENVREQEKNPPLLLAHCVFDHLRRQVLEQPWHWPDIHKQMAALFDEFPALKNAPRKEVFDGLTAAINAKPPVPNSIEALLLDWSRQPGAMCHRGLFHEADTPERKIVLRGASAVLDLMALLDDQRITTHEVPAFMNASARIQRVGELAATLLEEITGIRAAWPNTAPDATALRAWLEQKNQKGEAAVLAESAFIRKGGKITQVNEPPLLILAHKFPEQLVPLCAEFSQDAADDAQPFALAEAIATAPLPKETRGRILAEFAQRGSLAHKRCVLQNLAKLDDKKCAELLTPLFNEFRKDPPGSYDDSPEAAFAHVVMEIEDDDTWRNFLKVAKRSNVGLRMEMMNPLNYCYIGEKNRARRLAFLAAFLDDKTVRRMERDDKKFDGPCATFTIPKITVRDFAASQIASIIDLDDNPDEFWTAAEWKELRKKVNKKLAAEKLPSF